MKDKNGNTISSKRAKELLETYRFCPERIPTRFLSKDFCRFLLKDGKFWGEVLMPGKIKSYQFWSIAVELSGELLIFIPPEFKDIDLCVKAVLKSPELLYGLYENEDKYFPVDPLVREKILVEYKLKKI